jgi:protein-disulfide isomerase
MEDKTPPQVKKDDSISISKSSFKKILIGIIGIAILSAFFGGYFIGINSVEPEQIYIRSSEDVLGATENKQYAPPQTVLVSLDDDPVLGNPDAPLTIVEFSDFQCPFCAKFYAQTLPLIKENYIKSGQVNFVYRDFPINGIHPNAMPAALAAECADDQGKFWEYHDLVFTNQDSWKSLDVSSASMTFQEYAKELGLDTSEFSSCLTTAKHSQEVNKDLQDGQNYGVAGTPGFFIGNEKIGYVAVEGAKPYTTFEEVIGSQLTKIGT